jgi:hypothetical protein
LAERGAIIAQRFRATAFKNRFAAVLQVAYYTERAKSSRRGRVFCSGWDDRRSIKAKDYMKRKEDSWGREEG